MKFSDFIESIPKIKKNPLPGEKAQLLLSPEARPRFHSAFKKDSTREASVLLLMYNKNEETHIALILRSSYGGAHSGQVAMPGGKAEKEDLSQWETALRETEEEIGIPRKQIEFIKALTSVYIPTSDFRVYPFLAKTEKIDKFKLQKNEVAAVIEMPVKQLLLPENNVNLTIQISKNTSIIAPAFVYEDYKIWGATAMMLSELKQLLIESVGL